MANEHSCPADDNGLAPGSSQEPIPLSSLAATPTNEPFTTLKVRQAPKESVDAPGPIEEDDTGQEIRRLLTEWQATSDEQANTLEEPTLSSNTNAEQDRRIQQLVNRLQNVTVVDGDLKDALSKTNYNVRAAEVIYHLFKFETLTRRHTYTPNVPIDATQWIRDRRHACINGFLTELFQHQTGQSQSQSIPAAANTQRATTRRVDPSGFKGLPRVVLDPSMRISRGYHEPMHSYQTRPVQVVQGSAQHHLPRATRQTYPGRYNIPRPFYQPGRPDAVNPAHLHPSSSMSPPRRHPIPRTVQAQPQPHSSGYLSSSAPTASTYSGLDPSLFAIPESAEMNTLETNMDNMPQNDQTMIDYQAFGDIDFSLLDDMFSGMSNTSQAE